MAQKEPGGFPHEDLLGGEPEDGEQTPGNPLSVPEDLQEVFKNFSDLSDREEQLEAQLKRIQQEKAVCEELLIRAMDDSLVSKVTIKGVTFFRKVDRYPRVASQEDLFQYLNEQGRGDMIKPTVNAQTLRSYVLERLRENEQLPPCIEVFEKHRVQRRR